MMLLAARSNASTDLKAGRGPRRRKSKPVPSDEDTKTR
ncbi:hypothetical protein PA08_0399 [Cutibacterium modestum P08]|nr:hypothetical protein PA08_0399 [Cutibacterium modestum P08]